jgi:hypothetical protein
MSTKDTGGCAFPIRDTSENIVTGERTIHTTFDGFTVRDYFAAQALIPIIASAGPRGYEPSVAALRAYEQADAMLVERAK